MIVLESSHSGLVRSLGKRVWGQLHQGFKSLTLRQIMNKFFNIIFLVVVGVAGFIFRDTLKNIWAQTLANYFPCKTTISYTIGTFDTRFGLSKADFLSAIKSAEDIWEKPVGKELFEYKDKGNLKINLIYDVRQESTQKLQTIGSAVENTRSYYDSLKLQYESLSRSYEKEKLAFETRVSNFEARKSEYEADVSRANRRGGANKETYASLNAEKDYLSQESTELNAIQNNLNSKVSELNSLVKNLNDLAVSLNLNVKKYNTVGGSLGDEFDEGLYRTSPTGQEIDIYQFENKTKLIRVLAHELGHALGLDHIEDPKAIMYRLNNGINETLTQSDIVLVKKHCGI